MKAIIAVPATLALIYRAWSHNSLTPAGIAAATLTAIAHAYHPWNLPFVLLAVFFLGATRVTKIKHDVKTTLTMASKGSSGGEGPRTHVQVFANSFMASILTLLHAYQLEQRKKTLLDPSSPNPEGTFCYNWGGDILVVGIIAQYAAVAADTFSSELGILSKGQPRLITSLTFRRVPPGTNGGVTLLGLGAGFLGSMLIVTAAMLFLPLCGSDKGTTGASVEDPWTTTHKGIFMWGLTMWGVLGSILDSILGGLFQRTVKDVRSGKVVEGEGGVRVLASSGSTSESPGTQRKLAPVKAAVLSGEGKDAVPQTDPTIGGDSGAETRKDKYDHTNKNRTSSFGDEKPTRVVESGLDLLDNNDVNFLMAFTMSTGAMAVASWWWDIPLYKVLMP